MSDGLPSPCPVHPSETAFVACRKCETAACSYCLDAGPGDLCESCFARDEVRGVIAFERSDLSPPIRFFRTFRQVLRETGETFSALGDGPIGPSMLWAALCWALTSILSFAVLSPFMVLMSIGFSTPLPIGELSAPLFGILCCGGPLFQALVGVTGAFAAALVFHGSARVMGGQGSLATALRATGYAQAVVVIWGPLTLSMLLPRLGLIVVCLGFAAQLAWGTSVLSTVARAGYDLRGGRAFFAGAVPSILAALLLGVALTSGFLAKEATSPDLSPDRYEEPGSPDSYGR